MNTCGLRLHLAVVLQCSVVHILLVAKRTGRDSHLAAELHIYYNTPGGLRSLVLDQWQLQSRPLTSGASRQNKADGRLPCTAFFVHCRIPHTCGSLTGVFACRGRRKLLRATAAWIQHKFSQTLSCSCHLLSYLRMTVLTRRLDCAHPGLLAYELLELRGKSLLLLYTYSACMDSPSDDARLS